MKKIFILLLAFVMCVAADAAKINKQTALATAKRFVQNKALKMQFKSEPFEYKMQRAGSVADKTQLYIFNDNDNAGFVIVSAEDNTETILGYSTDQKFDAQNIPANMQYWLEGISREIEQVASEGGQVAYSNYYGEPIAPLVSSQWGQDAPYNTYVPRVNGEECPIGCVATAMAQIMYYHKWPVSATTRIPLYVSNTHLLFRPELPSTVFSWDDMQDKYDESSTNTEAVAKLMQYAAQSVMMDFTPHNSGSSITYCQTAYQNYFGYAKTVRLVERRNYILSQWYDIIYNELEHKRPVLYRGLTPNNSGHAFICDGFDGQGLFHINWGWDGIGDGYFRLSVLNPNNTSSSGAASTEDGYSEEQWIVIGIQPQGTDDTLYPWSLTYFTHSTTGGNSLIASISAVDAGTFEINLANENNDGTLTPLVTPVQRTFFKGQSSAATFKIDELPEGDYNIHVVVRKKGSAEWIKVGSESQYAEVSVGKNGVKSVLMHPSVNYTITDVYFPKNVVIGKWSRLNIDVKNLGDECDEKLFVFLGQNGVKNQDCGSVTLAMLSGEDYSISTSVQVKSTTNLTLFLAKDSECKDVVYEHTFYTYDLGIESSKVEWDPTAVTVTFKNNTPIPYKNTITATFYQVGKSRAIGTLSNDIEIDAGGTADLVYSLNFDKKQKYYVTFQHVSSELVSSKKSISGRVNIDYESSGIADVLVDEDNKNARTFNIMGQQVESSNAKGILIRNGKKFIQK